MLNTGIQQNSKTKLQNQANQCIIIEKVSQHLQQEKLVNMSAIAKFHSWYTKFFLKYLPTISR